jgi:hypothetical protein
MRLVLAVGIAGLVLGACGSTSKASQPAKVNATPTTRSGRTPITDLNGHVIVGVKAKDIAAESQPYQPLDKATAAKLARQLHEAKVVAMRYPTVASATAAGYRLVGGGFGPGSGAHYIGGVGGYSLNFDPNHPLALIYDGIHPKSKMVGLMYYSLSKNAPAGFAGPNDHWHRHSGVCMGPGGAVLFPPDSDVTARKCAIAKGFYMAITGWMVHTWVVPGWSSPDGVFSHENPRLTCADGTFHTDAVGRCQGS